MWSMSGGLFTHLSMYIRVSLGELQFCIVLGLSYCVQLLDFSVPLYLKTFCLHRKQRYTTAQGAG